VTGPGPPARGSVVKRLALLATVSAASMLLALVALEGGLRAAGYRPWRQIRTNPLEPVLHDPDAELGWVLRPGHWRYGPYAPGATPVEVTILPDRRRRTRPNPDLSGRGAPVLLLGCSFTFGWAVSDDETWAWGLQALRPDLAVENRGTGAYGTFQALLLLERVLASGERPARVLYGFIPQHGARNVGDPSWLKALGILSGQNITGPPYTTLAADGGLIRHPPEPYPAWPLRAHSAAMTLLQDTSYAFAARDRARTSDEVTRRLVAEMAERSRAAGARFSVVLLSVGAREREAIVPFARARGIDVIDCDRPLGLSDRVPGELHPNARVHAAWAECVAGALAP